MSANFSYYLRNKCAFVRLLYKSLKSQLHLRQLTRDLDFGVICCSIEKIINIDIFSKTKFSNLELRNKGNY